MTDAPTLIGPQDEGRNVLLIGQVVTVLTGDRARKFEPAVRDIELTDQNAGTRYRVQVDEANKPFAVFVPPGRYEITRVKIHEGPFLSMAHLASSFSVEEGAPVFVGTWRFGVDSPRYGRMVVVSMVLDDEARQQAEQELRETYPVLASSPMVTVLPAPSELQARLYEVAPYPRISRYFRRHNW
ncbi:MAG: hypothetical protein QM771_08100 [Nitrospira sp.]